MAVEKAVAVVMQESGRRALFDATQRLGANYREKAGLIKSKCQWATQVSVCVYDGAIDCLEVRQIACFFSFFFCSFLLFIILNAAI